VLARALAQDPETLRIAQHVNVAHGRAGAGGSILALWHDEIRLSRRHKLGSPLPTQVGPARLAQTITRNRGKPRLRGER
jgi:hypothetical protein